MVCEAKIHSVAYCFREKLTFPSTAVWNCLSGEVRAIVVEGAHTRTYTHTRAHLQNGAHRWLHTIHKHTYAFGWMPHVKVCRCECVFMQLRLIRKWDDGVFIWFYLVVLTRRLALSVAFLLPLWSSILMPERYASKDQFSPPFGTSPRQRTWSGDTNLVFIS